MLETIIPVLFGNYLLLIQFAKQRLTSVAIRLSAQNMEDLYKLLFFKVIDPLLAEVEALIEAITDESLKKWANNRE
jgi:hypothetical protein